MSHDMFHRLASMLTAVLVGVSGVAGVAPAEPVDRDPCAPTGDISIDDFLVWDSLGNGTGFAPVYSVAPCAYARTIRYETYDITAREGRDYVGVHSGVFTFPAGTDRITLAIEILGDNEREPAETFGIRLIDGADFKDPLAVVTIKDP